MRSRTTDDHQPMHAAGVRAAGEPAFWPGRPRTSPADPRETRKVADAAHEGNPDLRGGE